MNQGKRILAGCLAIAILFGLFPNLGGLIPTAQAADGATIDAFGIRMSDWTANEKKKAEGEAPFGVGYSTKTSVLTRSELYVSLGYDRDTRRTGVKDWNNGKKLSDLTGGVTGYNNDYMTQSGAPYTFVETAAMDLNNTGKDEYIATLAYTKSNKSIQLFVTDTRDQTVAGPITVANGDSLKQMEDLDTYELRGAMTVAAGDFDGDGKDTIVVYIPTVDNGVNPYIREYSVSGGSLTQKSTITDNVFGLLNVNGLKDLKEHDLENQPMVSLVAEDTDKDGFDELVITGGMNDVDSDNDNDNKDGRLGSQIFVYEWSGQTWMSSFHTDMNVNGGSANSAGRIVWASATVGNMIASTSTAANTVDYPEILAAGFVDGEKKDFWNINVDGSDPIGVTAVRVDADNPVSSTSYSFTVGGVAAQNVVCNYEVAFQRQISPNDFTKGGFYEGDDANSLLAVQAFADKGSGAEESVFISGTVYQVASDGLAALYTPSYFQDDDDGAGSHLVTNAIVQTVTAGNFDGNDTGKEQLLCATSLRQSGKNNSYSQLHCIYNDAASDSTQDSWQHVRSDYLVSHKGAFYITLNAVDTDKDSTIVTLKDVTRTYSQPDVLAILEATPYFREIGDGDTGNGQTVYGTSASSGSGSSNTFGFSAGVTVGYESDSLFGGGGFEATIDNSFNWSTANSKSTEWSIEYANDTGENLVVVYRCPVVTYLYEDQDGKDLLVNKSGTPATSMIPVEDYNEAAGEYNLDRITDAVVDLATPGNPLSYRNSPEALTNALTGEAASTTNGSAQVSPDGWVQYASLGTTQQALSESKEQEKTFEYGLDVSFSIWGKVFGAKVGGSTGFSYNYSKTSVNGTGVTKAGSVTGQQVDGYDFQWKFVTWQAKINSNTVPVLGYLVQDVEAPPSPAQNLTADTITRNSITLSWDIGDRPAQQYRIYRVLEDSSTPYVLVGATDGNTTSYTLTDLQPGTTYTYVVRGVGYDDAGNAKISVDSSQVTARTTSADAVDLVITLTGVDDDGVLRSDGAQASITANVYNPMPGSSTSYQWQIRAPGNARWLSLINGSGNDGVGSVAGATAQALTLKQIDKSLGGGALRCVVTVSALDGTPEYYYSAIAPLNLEGNRTETHIQVTGAGTAAGTVSDPYTALSDYTTSATVEKSETVQVPVTVEQGGVIYSIYTDGNTYVALVYGADGDAQYYAASENDGTYSIGAPLTGGAITYYHSGTDGDEVYPTPDGFDGYSTVTSEDGAYLQVYLFENGVPTTEYWYHVADGLYYTRSGASFTALETQPTGDLRTVYRSNLTDGLIVDEAEGLAVEEPEEDAETAEAQPGTGYETYEIYRLNEDGRTYKLSTVIWAVGDSKLYTGEQQAYADRGSLTAETAERTVTSQVTTYEQNEGTTLTLSAKVSLKDVGQAVNTQVEYVITNTATGSRTTLVAASGDTVMWRAPSTGLYQITVTSRKTDSALSSSDTCYYYARAVDPNNTATEYRLLVEQNGQPVTSAQYNGQQYTLTLESRTAADTEHEPGVWSEVSGASYTVNGQPLSQASYVPGSAGTFDFAALVDGRQVAAQRLELSKIPISVTTAWEGMEEVTANATPNLKDIDIVVDSGKMVGADAQLLKDALTISCGFYTADGGKQNVTGAFDVALAWSTTGTGENQTLTAAAQELQSKYEVTLLTQKLYSLSDSVVVTYRYGENGTVHAEYSDDSGTQFPVPASTGTSVPGDYKVVFTATPNSGFAVGRWTINGQAVTSGIVTYPNGGQTMSVELSPYKDLGELDVEVTFVSNSNTIHFSADEHGSIAAVDGDQHPLTTGSNITYGSSITFTAKPDEGYMVKYWTVDDVAYTWPGTNETYRSNTLTLDKLSDSHSVTVFFEEAAYTDVTTSVVDSSETASSAATISVADTAGKAVEGKDGSYTVQQGTALVFTANSVAGTSNTTVREWQTSPDGQSWTTVTGSGGQTSLTIHNPTGEKLFVRAMVDTAQNFTLYWAVEMEDGGEVPADAAAVLTAASSGVALTNGGVQAAYIPVEFALELNDAYYVAGWSDNVTGNGKTALLESLTGNTQVTVAIAHKPVVTIQNGEGGTVTVTGTVNGLANQSVPDGQYVDPGSELLVTATPDTGYGVAAPADAAFVNEAASDVKTYIIPNVQTDQRIDPAFAELPTYQIAFSVVDTNSGEAGGLNGTLTADASRKGMEAYAKNGFASGTEITGDSTVTFTATPDDGFRILAWTWVNGEGETETIQDQGVNYTGTTLELAKENLSRANTVTVEFVYLGSSITFEAVNGAITSAMVGGNTIENGATLNPGTTLTLKAQANPGYEIQHWIVNDKIQPDSASDTFQYTAPATGATGAVIRAVYQPVAYGVTWTADSHGTVAANGYAGSSAQIRGGTQVTFTAVPDSGYSVAAWTVNGSPVEGNSSNTFTWTVPNGQAAEPNVSNYVIGVTFTGDSYTLTYAQPENGALKASAASGAAVTGGTQVTFTAVPDSGYQVFYWLVNGQRVESTSTAHTVTIEGNTTVAVVLTATAHTVTFSATEGGSVTCAQGQSPVTVAHGGSVTLTAAAETYYDLTHWLVNGEEVAGAAGKPLVLQNITEDLEVQAVFAKQVFYNVRFSVDGGGGTLSAALDGAAFTPGENGQPVPGGSTLVFTAAPGEGMMVAGWTINGTPVTKENLASLGISMAHPLAKTLTIHAGRPLDVQVSYEAYTGYDIPVSTAGWTISDVKRLPDDTDAINQIRKNGDVTFTVGMAEGYTTISKLVVNGYDCLTKAGTAVGCDGVNAEQNANGTWTVTVTNVTNDIRAEIEAHKLVVGTLTAVPDALREHENLDTVEEIQAKLDTQLTGSKDGKAYLDIVLRYKGEQGQWEDVTQFPEDGVDVTIDYPSGADSRDTFTIVHMLTTAGTAGQMEMIRNYTKDADGIHFHVSSLSPFAIGWTKYSAPAGGGGGSIGGGGGGGGAAAETYAVTVIRSDGGEVTVRTESAAAGDEITVTVRADTGYTATGVTVTDGAGNAVAVTAIGDGAYTFRMPESAVTVAGNFLRDQAASCPSEAFTDLTSDWYHEAVDYVVSHGLMTGVSDDRFAPDSTLTRGMIVTSLWRMENEPQVDAVMPFTDVAAGEWYTEAIRWAASEGIVNGVSEDSFAPDSILTREQMATVLYRYAQYKGLETAAAAGQLDGFADRSAVADYAETAMNWAVAQKLINGTADATLSPQGTATRAQLATIFMRFCESMERASK